MTINKFLNVRPRLIHPIMVFLDYLLWNFVKLEQLRLQLFLLGLIRESYLHLFLRYLY